MNKNKIKALAIFITVISVILFFKLFQKNHQSTEDIRFSVIPTKNSTLEFRSEDIAKDIQSSHHKKVLTILNSVSGLAIADVNNDNLLDIFFVNNQKFFKDRNALFLNKGNFRFERFKLGQLTSFARNYVYYGIPTYAKFVDYDNDGDQDLALSNIFGRNGYSKLFQNTLVEQNNLDYREKSVQYKFNNFTNSLSNQWVDLNNDGRLDLIINNMINSEINLKTKCKKNPLKKSNCPLNEQLTYKLSNSQDQLYLNLEKRFLKSNNHKNYLKINTSSWKNIKADFNNDSLTEEIFPLINNIKVDSSYTNMAIVDFNNDGLMDIVLSSNQHSPILLKNMSQNSNNFLGIKLVSKNTRCNRDAIDSTLVLTIKNSKNKTLTLKRNISHNDLYYALDPRVHFGVSNNYKIEKLVVNWCNAIKKEYSQQQINLNTYQTLILD